MRTTGEVVMTANAFFDARDLLLRLRDDYSAAYREFQWPQLPEFNWALDYFDVMANFNDGVALHVVNDDGSEEKLIFDELRDRSNRVANFLRIEGVKRGDRVLIMLG